MQTQGMRARGMGAGFVMVILGAIATETIHADQFHYSNILIGDRASGMGGAFGAVADDASGVHYNPAGLAFALSNDISGSANAFYQKDITYKKAAIDSDFVEKSKGSIAPFFGVLGKADSVMQGLTFAFGYMTLDSELKDQDDLISKQTDVSLSRFHRTANMRAATNKVSAAVAKRLGGSFSVGIGLSYTMVDELTQIYQDSKATANAYQIDTDGEFVLDENGDKVAQENCCYRYLTSNSRERLIATAVEPMIGIQYAFLGKFSIGATVKVPTMIEDKFEASAESSITYADLDGKAVDVSETGRYTQEQLANIDSIEPSRTVVEPNVKSGAMGGLPMESRLSFAWFASARSLLTADAIHFGEASGKSSLFKRDSVLNYAVGTEYYTTPSWPVRFGFFTNNDARPKPKSTSFNQQDSVDYVGYTAQLAFVQPNSQIAVGAMMQQGSGKSQKIAGSSTIQTVEATYWSAGFSVSHNF